MSEYEQIIDEIVKHGVAVKVNEIVDDNYIPYERKYVGCVVKLDFTEHDKVFEDKIVELKKDYKTASELLGKYQQENESLKKRIIELEDFSCQAEQETESLVEKLNQRIAELESMEMENFSEINTSNPLACAKSLIEHMTHCEKFMIMPERDVQTFSVEELKEIADYLMVYYKHHKDRDAEDTISF